MDLVKEKLGMGDQISKQWIADKIYYLVLDVAKEIMVTFFHCQY